MKSQDFLKKKNVSKQIIRPQISPTVGLKGQCHEFFASGFFHESVSPQPQSIPLRPFQIISKICGDIRNSRSTTGVNDTGGKFATGINDTGIKFFHQFR
jgi:hypothetical protein